MLNMRGYVFSRPFLGERLPQNVQNLVIRDYCIKKNYNFLLSATEYAMDNCSLMLNKILNDLDSIDGIVMYSMFQLPENNEERKDIVIKVINKRKLLSFALENILINSIDDFNMADEIWRIKKLTFNTSFK